VSSIGPRPIHREKSLEMLLGLGIGTLVLIAVGWLLPIVLVLTSSRTTGLEKLFWVVLILFFSWFSWVLYLFIAPVEKRSDAR
jgi:hypothetical protein